MGAPAVPRLGAVPWELPHRVDPDGEDRLHRLPHAVADEEQQGSIHAAVRSDLARSATPQETSLLCLSAIAIECPGKSVLSTFRAWGGTTRPTPPSSSRHDRLRTEHPNVDAGVSRATPARPLRCSRIVDGSGRLTTALQWWVDLPRLPRPSRRRDDPAPGYEPLPSVAPRLQQACLPVTGGRVDLRSRHRATSGSRSPVPIRTRSEVLHPRRVTGPVCCSVPLPSDTANRKT